MPRSDVMGPMEHASQPFIEQLRAPYAAGASAQFDAATCKDYADLIEILAQAADQRQAQLDRMGRQQRNHGCLVALCSALMIGLLVAILAFAAS